MGAVAGRTRRSGRAPAPGASRPAAYHGRPDRRRTLARERRPATRDRDPPTARSGSSRPTRRSPPRPTPTADLYDEAERDPEAFWAKIARETVTWNEPFDDDARVGPAVREVVRRWQAEHQPTTASTATSRTASAARSPTTGSASPATRGRSPTRTSTARSRRRPTPSSELGIGKGDRVAIYMPMIPELPIAMLACARIGAPHTVVFAGFSAEALSAAGSTTPRRSSSSPPTAAIGAARRCR